MRWIAPWRSVPVVGTIMDEMDPILVEIDRLICLSRLREIEFIMNTGLDQRLRKIANALCRLDYGEYLLGTGPSTVGIIRLGPGEIVLGRPATHCEAPPEVLPDQLAADTLYFTPREVSRVHAKVLGRVFDGAVQYVVADLDSTCGTYVNGRRIDPDGPGVRLSPGDVVSLGPSQTNTYVYYEAARARTAEEVFFQEQDQSW